MLVVKCSRCGGESHLMDALRELGIGIGEPVLFGFIGEVEPDGELSIVPGRCENLGSIGRHRGQVPDYLMPVEVDPDIIVPGPGVYQFQVWVEVGPYAINIWHNPEVGPQQADTILTGLEEVFADGDNATWNIDLM